MLAEEAQYRIEAFRQLEIALRCRQWNHPKEVNRLFVKAQLIRQRPVALDQRWHEENGVENGATPEWSRRIAVRDCMT